MIAFLGGLGLAGLALVYLLFVKRRSLEPQQAAALLGVRIIVAVALILSLFIYKYYQDTKGRDFFGNLTLKKDDIIGKWDVEFVYKNDELNRDDDKIYRYAISFYPDSTYFSNLGGEGIWWYDYKHEKLFMRDKTNGKLNDYLNEFSLEKYDPIHIYFYDGSSFAKLSDTPESQENIKKILAEVAKQKAEEEKIKADSIASVTKTVVSVGRKLELVETILSTDITGQWNLKKVQYNGTLTNDLGIYSLNADGTGTYNNTASIKYKLDKDKKRFTLSRPDEVIILNVKSYDGEVLIGYPNEEPDSKYVFTKAL